MRIKEMPDDMRPDERARTLGIEALSDKELLAIIIRTGTKGKSSVELADEILSINKGKRGLLNLLGCSYSDFTSLRGLGEVKALQLACICELSKRISKIRVLRDGTVVDSVFAASFYMEELRHLEYEVIYVMLVDVKGRLIKSVMASKGSATAAVTGIREILKIAISEGNAAGLYMVHNHPSGDTKPSFQDIRFSKALKSGAESLGLIFCDSIIIGDGEYSSLSQKGLI